MEMIKTEDSKKLQGADLTRALENFHTFVSSYSFWIDKNRVPKEVSRWPVLEEEVLGDHGYHGVISYSLTVGPKLVPIKQKISGVSLWEDCEILGYSDKRSIDISTRVIFENIYSQNERADLKKYLNEMSRFINEAIGFSDKEFEELKNSNLNFGAHVYMVNPRKEFHSGGGLSLKSKTIDSVLNELFAKIDLKTRLALKPRLGLLNK